LDDAGCVTDVDTVEDLEVAERLLRRNESRNQARVGGVEKSCCPLRLHMPWTRKTTLRWVRASRCDITHQAAVQFDPAQS
jgi:hypothetical protein